MFTSVIGEITVGQCHFNVRTVIRTSSFSYSNAVSKANKKLQGLVSGNSHYGAQAGSQYLCVPDWGYVTRPVNYGKFATICQIASGGFY